MLIQLWGFLLLRTDPWDLGGLGESLPSGPTYAEDPHKPKDAKQFLGNHADLVNLDQLVSKPAGKNEMIRSVGCEMTYHGWGNTSLMSDKRTNGPKWWHTLTDVRPTFSNTIQPTYVRNCISVTRQPTSYKKCPSVLILFYVCFTLSKNAIPRLINY